MKQIDVHALNELRHANQPHQLIDVREIHEVELCSIGGNHIPMGEILNRHEELRRDVPVIIHCRSGQRSQAVVTALENNFDYTNLHNLTGGIIAWVREIDPSLEAY